MLRPRSSAALLALSLLGGVLSVSTAVPAKERKHKDKDRSSHEEHCRQDCRRSGDGDREGNRYCFFTCDFVIVIPAPTPAPGGGGGDGQQALAVPPACLPYPHCDPRPAALFPPSPQKLAEAIQAGAEGIGKAAGALAGAIGAFPPALLL